MPPGNQEPSPRSGRPRGAEWRGGSGGNKVCTAGHSESLRGVAGPTGDLGHMAPSSPVPCPAWTNDSVLPTLGEGPAPGQVGGALRGCGPREAAHMGCLLWRPSHGPHATLRRRWVGIKETEAKTSGFYYISLQRVQRYKEKSVQVREDGQGPAKGALSCPPCPLQWPARKAAGCPQRVYMRGRAGPTAHLHMSVARACC